MTDAYDWVQDAADDAGGLDLLLTDAALGVLRRFRDTSVRRLAGKLARDPRIAGRQAARFGAELGAIVVNPPASPKAKFRTATANPADPRRFLASATEVAGSWWPDYADWLAARGGGQHDRPSRLGSEAYPVLCGASGTYVHDH